MAPNIGRNAKPEAVVAARPHPLVAGLLLACLIASIPGCGRRAATAVAPMGASPVVRGADNGLEAWWWVVSDSRVVASLPLAPAGPDSVAVGPDGTGVEPAPAPRHLDVLDLKADLAELLSTYESSPAPTDDAVRERCRAAGLRLVAVPIEDLPAIESRLRLVGAVQRQWLGEPAQWTDVARGPVTGPRTVSDGRVLIDLSPGALRLMLRAWIVPEWPGTAAGPGAALRVELVPELVPERTRIPGLRAARSPREPAPPAAESLDALRWTLVLRPGEACLIVPESPDQHWDRPAPEPGAPSPAGGPLGPAAPDAPTLGESMLAVDRQEGPPRRVRAVIVLIPRLPDRYHLSAAQNSR